MVTDGAEEAQVSQVDTKWADLVAQYFSGHRDSTPAVTIMPTKLDRGVALFPDIHTTTAKELRAFGVTADFLHTPNGKRFIGQYSVVTEFLGAFLFSLGSDAAWDACKVTFSLLRARLGLSTGSKSDQARIRVGALTGQDGTQILWYEISGPSDRVLETGEDLIARQIAAFYGKPGEAETTD